MDLKEKENYRGNKKESGRTKGSTWWTPEGRVYRGPTPVREVGLRGQRGDGRDVRRVTVGRERFVSRVTLRKTRFRGRRRPWGDAVTKD